MYKAKNIALGIIILIIIIVLFQNAESARVDFLFWSFSASEFIVYIAFFILGIISALLFNIWRKI